ncbi:MAG TPA: cytochrome c3 family protein, partial [Terriglobales bacterium]|nr:cytochrome c3 family protein [Terriglobales bacterium]
MKTLKSFLIAVAMLVLIGAIFCLFFISRGFRANSVPGRVESRVARSLRDFAIPGSERRRKNPLEASSDVLAQGRESFVAQCAACHGVDGSARTQIGVNLYPRAPDLRSAATQSLSDGEMHYIIENGVQLTGMPAWGNPHAEASGDSWKLVLFIRSLSPLTDQEKSQSASDAHYVGSRACEKCHAEIYQRWKKTPMANVVRDPREHPDAILPDLTANTVAKFSKDQVALVYGSVWKQRYFTRVGDDYFPLPAQWDVATHAWLPYNVPRKGADWWTAFYPPDNMQRPTSSTCDGCHSVGYDIQRRQVAEWNVGCERCHGPGSDHVSHPSRGNIVNPAQMDSAAADNVCIQCHSQGRPPSGAIAGKYYDWPVGYRVGLKLEDFWTLEDCTLGQTSFYYFPDCTAHKNRMQGNDFVQSVMYTRGVTCFSCHDVHGTENPAVLWKPANRICLDCHGPGSPNGPRTATLE